MNKNFIEIETFSLNFNPNLAFKKQSLLSWCFEGAKEIGAKAGSAAKEAAKKASGKSLAKG